MKKQPPKKYQPGELERTRKNLGTISEDEARKMSQLFGGEVGIEQDPEELARQYRKLEIIEQKKKRLRKLESLRTERIRARRERTGSAYEGTQRTTGRPNETKTELGYFDRLRIDYLATKPEYRIKNMSGVIAAVFSFLGVTQDRINPLFIRNAERLFFISLSTFVNAVRALFTKTRREVYREISRNGFYASILATLKTWDIEGINIEIGTLQRRPYGQQVKKSRELVRKIYHPFGVLLLCDPETHIRRAIKWAYDMNIAHTPSENHAVWKTITQFYEDANEYLPVVFTEIKQMFYPLMLKFTSVKFMFFEEYIELERKAILRFLAIDPENIVNPADEKTIRPYGDGKDSAQDGEDNDEDDDSQESEEDNEGGTSATRNDYEKGIVLLERLFPHAGWKDLDRYPDLYPYFQPLFDFPSGFELVPRFDPLHLVVVLATIINSLFYGFRHIGFNPGKTGSFEQGNCKEKAETFLTQWPVFLNEIVYKAYLTRLQDYCRNIEKDGTYIASELGAKARNELVSIKSAYLLPYLRAGVSVQFPGGIQKNYPKFHRVVTETRRFLRDVEKGANKPTITNESTSDVIFSSIPADCEHVLNPSERFMFDLENPVSQRLEKILEPMPKQPVERRTNMTLIRACRILVSMLDYLLNAKSSPFYARETQQLFRSVNDSGETPLYSVPLRDTEEMLAQENRKQPDADGSVKHGAPSGSLPGVPGILSATEVVQHIEQEIREWKISPAPLSFIHIECTRSAERQKEIVLPAIRPEKDVLLRTGEKEFLVVAHNTTLNQAMDHTMKILASLAKLPEFHAPSDYPVAGVFQFRKEWKTEMVMSIILKVRTVVKKQSAARLVFLDNETLTLKGIPLK